MLAFLSHKDSKNNATNVERVLLVGGIFAATRSSLFSQSRLRVTEADPPWPGLRLGAGSVASPGLTGTDLHNDH